MISIEQKIESMEKGIGRLEAGFAEFSEFMIFVKNQFERQETKLDALSSDMNEVKTRLNNIEGTLSGIQQAFWFKAF